MFLLDTNVVSELRKFNANKADVNVAKWARATLREQAFISAATVFELERGVLQMERRDAVQGRVLRQWLDDYVLVNYDGRIIPFDTGTAVRCAFLHVPNPKPDYDAMIAATALEHSLVVVTRNIQDFEGMGVKLLNPWI